MRLLSTFSIFLISLISLATLSCQHRQADETLMNRSDKEVQDVASAAPLTYVFVDCGLGGMSVMAQTMGRHYLRRTHQNVRSVFFNALFSPDIGFSSIPHKHLVKIFSQTLESAETRYRPDLILIACNTLSVIYEETEFSKQSSTKVITIVNASTTQMLNTLQSEPQDDQASIVIFGTPVTARSHRYRDELAARGIDKSRVIEIACSGLVGQIEQSLGGSGTYEIIKNCVSESLAQIPKSKPFYASLNCTHFPYATTLWQKAFEELGRSPRKLLNPNEAMVDELFPSSLKQNQYAQTTTSAEVVSMYPFRKAAVAQIADYLGQRWSPKTADALRNYKIIDDLFPWKNVLNEEKLPGEMN